MKAVILVFILFLSTTNDISFCHGNSHVMNCIESERQALLTFKQHLTDPSNRLSSWALDNNYCCKWVGVVCDNLTAHVKELHLQNPHSDYKNEAEFEAYKAEYEAYKRSTLGGKINSSLLNLKHLSYLNLSYNDFGGIKIPNFIGSLGSLRYLDFSSAGFSGMIPYQLGNLSSLLHLGLKSYYVGLYVENLQWISGLSSLEHLDLSSVNLVKASDWLQVINMLPSLIELHLSSCYVRGDIPPLPHINFTSLSILDLSHTHFNSTIPNWLYSLSHLESLSLRDNSWHGMISSAVGNLASLTSLDLSWNQFEGAIPSTVGNLASLTSLDLSGNQLKGAIPSTVGNLASLTSLDLSENQLKGAIPNTVGNLASLTSLDLSGNQLKGAIPNTVGNLASLTSLDLSDNQLEGAISRSLENLCNLKVLDLSNNKLFGPLPDYLRQFVNLVYLSLRNNSFSGPIPTSLGSLSSLRLFDIGNNQLNGTLPESLRHLSKLETLDISNNFLEGVVSEVHFANLTNLQFLWAPENSLVLKVSPDWIPRFHLYDINLRSWHLGPKFPMWLKSQQNLEFVDLTNTRISNYIPIWFWNISPHIYLGSNQLSGPLPHISSDLVDLDLSNNSFSGNISHFLCDRTNESNMLEVLDLGKNLLSGKIPDCWVNWQSLYFINLEDNNFTGKIPSSMRYLRTLYSLHLRNNSLSGEIPSSLQNCTSLTTLDLSLNEFEGSIPTWMGSNISYLSVLNLRSNKFNGKIPLELCHLSNIQIMDLAENNLSGTIPHCFSNLKNMARKEFSGLRGPIVYSNGSREVVENAFVVTKGREFQYYAMILSLVASLDLSRNNLSGEVPKELTSLLGLFSLNLSNNHLIGRIPDKIGNMELLESLDFSRNQFFGEIPPSISNLTFLSHLDLSYNNLSGKIPLSTQLQSLNASSFVGNQLCGPPLTENCSPDGIPPNSGNGRYEGSDGFRVKWFYLSMMMGFVVGFWSVCGPLLFNKSWRCAYFRLLDQKWDNLCYRFYNFF